MMQVVAAIRYCYCYCEKSQPVSQGLLVLSLSCRTGRSLFRSPALSLLKKKLSANLSLSSPKNLPGPRCSKAD